jgi:hypothetical protein
VDVSQGNIYHQVCKNEAWVEKMHAERSQRHTYFMMSLQSLSLPLLLIVLAEGHPSASKSSSESSKAKGSLRAGLRRGSRNENPIMFSLLDELKLLVAWGGGRFMCFVKRVFFIGVATRQSHWLDQIMPNGPSCSGNVCVATRPM